MFRLTRYDFIRGPRAERMRRDRVRKQLTQEILQRANVTVQRVLNSHMTFPEIGKKPHELVNNKKDVEISTLKTRLKHALAEKDKYKQQAETLENLLNLKNENTEEILNVKKTLTAIVLCRLKEYGKNLNLFTTEQLAQLVFMEAGKFEHITVGQLLNFGYTMELDLSIEFVKFHQVALATANPLKGRISVHYIVPESERGEPRYDGPEGQHLNIKYGVEK